MKIDKNKIVFISVIALVTLFIAGYSIFALGGKEGEEDDLQHTLVPELAEDQETFTSKKEAVDAIEDKRERLAPSVYDDRMLDSLGYFDPDLIDKRKQRLVDSIYQIGRIDYSQDSIPLRNRKPIQRKRTLKKEAIDARDTISPLKAMGLEHQLFFAVSPEVLAEGTGESLTVEIDGEQTVKVNDRLQMRVVENTTIQGIEVKKNTLLYGIVKFRPNRVILAVNNIRGFPIKLKAYDNADGLEGIYIKNSFRGDVFNEVLGDVIEDINIPGVPQIGGIKQVFQRNNRKVKVTVNNNYRLTLKLKL